MVYLARLRWLIAWAAVLGMLSLPLATAQAMDFDLRPMTTVADSTQPASDLMSSDTDSCCVTHPSGKTVDDCGKIACVGAVSCIAKCVPGTAVLVNKTARDVFGTHFIPADDVTIALYGPEPPMEPPRS